MSKTTRIDIELRPRELFQAIRASEFSPRGVDMYGVDPSEDSISITPSQYGNRYYLTVIVEEEQ